MFWRDQIAPDQTPRVNPAAGAPAFLRFVARRVPAKDLRVPDSIANFLPAQSGHFLFESGHHGDVWLELDSLWARPDLLEPAVAALARRLARHRPDAVCGPQTGGARLARLIAAHLGVRWFATARLPAAAVRDPGRPRLYQARYSLSSADRAAVADRRVAVVDDVINAGSATRATLAELSVHGARPVAVGALLVLNEPAARLAAERGLPLEALDRMQSHLWEPAACRLCAQGVPLTQPA